MVCVAELRLDGPLEPAVGRSPILRSPYTGHGRIGAIVNRTPLRTPTFDGGVAARNETSLCQEALRDFFPTGAWAFAAREVTVGRMVGMGLGVACPKSWRLGCEPATLETEPFPLCPPGPA
jgi:hypothetical protein